jgi:hypothetical protein
MDLIQAEIINLRRLLSSLLIGEHPEIFKDYNRKLLLAVKAKKLKDSGRLFSNTTVGSYYAAGGKG